MLWHLACASKSTTFWRSWRPGTNPFWIGEAYFAKGALSFHSQPDAMLLLSLFLSEWTCLARADSAFRCVLVLCFGDEAPSGVVEASVQALAAAGEAVHLSKCVASVHSRRSPCCKGDAVRACGGILRSLCGVEEVTGAWRGRAGQIHRRGPSLNDRAGRRCVDGFLGEDRFPFCFQLAEVGVDVG